MERIIMQNKFDVIDSLEVIRRDLRHIRTSHFNRGIVTKESWEASPSARISYHKSKIPMLKEAGVMKDPKDFEYGWHFSNEYYAKVSKEVQNADKLLNEILCYLQDCNVWPKTCRFTEEEMSRFKVIQGGGRASWLVSNLMGGVVND